MIVRLENRRILVSVKVTFGPQKQLTKEEPWFFHAQVRKIWIFSPASVQNATSSSTQIEYQLEGVFVLHHLH